jgi:GMP synthase-like glutamine amidotransferase
MKIHCIRHEPFEGLACILNWINKHGHTLTFTHTHLNQSFPTEIDFDLLIIMGGTASLYDKKNKAWLKYESKFVSKALGANKKILGICLGAQIIAHVLGAEIYKNNKREIGWFETTFHDEGISIMPFLPKKIVPFHWHSDTFDLPQGAIGIASSEITPNQGFIYKSNVIALQFHLELNHENLKKITRALKSELLETDDNIQSAKHILSKTDLINSGNSLMFEIMDFLAQ